MTIAFVFMYHNAYRIDVQVLCDGRCTGCVLWLQGESRQLLTGVESRVFWLSLVGAEVLWCLFLFSCFFRFNFQWMVSHLDSEAIKTLCSLAYGKQSWFAIVMLQVKTLLLSTIIQSLFNRGLSIFREESMCILKQRNNKALRKQIGKKLACLNSKSLCPAF